MAAESSLTIDEVAMLIGRKDLEIFALRKDVQRLTELVQAIQAGREKTNMPEPQGQPE